jgi:chemotaxis protein MotB
MRALPFLTLGLALCLPACVTTGTFNQLQHKADDLQSQLDEIHKEAKGLQTDLGTEKEANAQLSADKSTLTQQKTELEQVKDSLQARSAELEAKTAQLTSQTAQLQQTQADLAAQKDALAAQNAALAAEKQALEKEAADKQAQYQSLVGDLKKEVNEGQLKITQYKNMLTLDVADKILFDSGKADLKAPGKAVLMKVASALAKDDKVIRVVGHTDNVPLTANAAFASNWELSTARATTVVRFLQEQGRLAPQRLLAEGRGEYAPVAPNDTPEGRQKNRRIEITLLDRSLVDAMVLAPVTLSPTAAAASPSPK